jgi:uncharacterized protein
MTEHPETHGEYIRRIPLVRTRCTTIGIGTLFRQTGDHLVIQIQPHAEGATLAVRAQPGAKKNAILGEQAESLKIAVTALPEEGRANEALVELLRKWLSRRRSEIELLVGHTNRNKVFLIRGLTPDQLRAAVSEKLGS